MAYCQAFSFGSRLTPCGLRLKRAENERMGKSQTSIYRFQIRCSHLLGLHFQNQSEALMGSGARWILWPNDTKHIFCAESFLFPCTHLTLRLTVDQAAHKDPEKHPQPHVERESHLPRSDRWGHAAQDPQVHSVQHKRTPPMPIYVIVHRTA